jgi:hypothetical protein
MKKKTCLLVAFFAILFCVSSVSAATWYVDKDATGLNDGTSWENAWQSFADINWNKIQPGDTVYISGGSTSKTYNEGLTIGASGSEGNPITIKVGQDSGHNGIVILEGGADYGIHVNGKSWVTISGQLDNGIEPNMIVRNYNKDAILLQSITGIVVEYLEVGPITNYGPAYGHCVHIRDGYIGGSNRVHHNKIHDCYDYGIIIRDTSDLFKNDDYLRIDHNEIYNLGHDGIHAGASAGGLTIDHNEIHTALSGENQNPVYIDGMHLRGFNYLTVAYNKIYDLEGPDGMYAYLYFEADTGQSNVSANDIYVYNNVIYETDQSYDHYSVGIAFGCKACTSLTNVSILNNTIVDMEYNVLAFNTYNANPVSNVIIANNIIYNGCLNNIGSNRYLIGLSHLDGITTGSFGDTPTPDIIWDYNLVDVSNSDTIMATYNDKPYNYNDWKSVSGCDANGVTSDPTFVNWIEGNAVDLHLDATDTAAINQGRTRTEFSDDYDGITRPQGNAWDIGAYEYHKLAPSPPTNLRVVNN